MTVSFTLRRGLFFLAAVALVADLGTKYLVFRWLHGHPEYYDPVSRQGSYELIPGAFRLHTQYVAEPAVGKLQSWNAPDRPHVNQGALFGLGNDRKTSNIVFAVISLIAAGTIIAWSLRPHSITDRWLGIALGLILGGTLGNFFDRVVFGGVRDFLYWYKFVDWPVFNIADCCLVVGAGLLLGHAFLANPSSVPGPSVEDRLDNQPVTRPAPVSAPGP